MIHLRFTVMRVTRVSRSSHTTVLCELHDARSSAAKQRSGGIRCPSVGVFPSFPDINKICTYHHSSSSHTSTHEHIRARTSMLRAARLVTSVNPCLRVPLSLYISARDVRPRSCEAAKRGIIIYLNRLMNNSIF